MRRLFLLLGTVIVSVGSACGEAGAAVDSGNPQPIHFAIGESTTPQVANGTYETPITLGYLSGGDGGTPVMIIIETTLPVRYQLNASFTDLQVGKAQVPSPITVSLSLVQDAGVAAWFAASDAGTMTITRFDGGSVAVSLAALRFTPSPLDGGATGTFRLDMEIDAALRLN